MPKSVTRRDLAAAVAEKTGLSHVLSRESVDQMLNVIQSGLVTGKRIDLRGFGTLSVRIRKAGVGRNPKQPGSRVPFPAHRVVRYRAGRQMHAALNPSL